MQTKPADVLADLESEFHTHAARLKGAEAELRQAVGKMRSLGQAHEPSPEWKESWSRITESLQRIQGLADEIETAIESGDRAEMKQALEPAAEFQGHDAALTRELSQIRDQMSGNDAAGHADWNTLADAVGASLDAIHHGIRVLKLKLDLAEGRTPEQVREFVRQVMRQLAEHPCPEGTDPHEYEMEFLKSSIELAHEQHQELGFPMILKTLLTWYENPEERTQRNLHIPVD